MRGKCNAWYSYGMRLVGNDGGGLDGEVLGCWEG